MFGLLNDDANRWDRDGRGRGRGGWGIRETASADWAIASSFRGTCPLFRCCLGQPGGFHRLKKISGFSSFFTGHHEA